MERGKGHIKSSSHQMLQVRGSIRLPHAKMPLPVRAQLWRFLGNSPFEHIPSSRGREYGALWLEGVGRGGLNFEGGNVKCATPRALRVNERLVRAWVHILHSRD